MKRILLLALALGAAACSAPSEGTDEVTFVQERIDHPNEGDATQICVGQSYGPANGYTVFQKFPAWRKVVNGVPTDEWYSHTLNADAKVYSSSCVIRVVDGVPTRPLQPDSRHNVHWQVPNSPTESRDYINGDGRRRLFLLESATDPSGPTEYNAGVYVDRND